MCHLHWSYSSSFNTHAFFWSSWMNNWLLAVISADKHAIADSNAKTGINKQFWFNLVFSCFILFCFNFLASENTEEQFKVRYNHVYWRFICKTRSSWPSWHTTLSQCSYNVIWMLFSLDGRCFDSGDSQPSSSSILFLQVRSKISLPSLMISLHPIMKLF